MGWLDNITHSIDMNLSKFQVIVGTEKACMLRSMSQKRVGHNLVTEQQVSTLSTMGISDNTKGILRWKGNGEDISRDSWNPTKNSVLFPFLAFVVFSPNSSVYRNSVLNTSTGRTLPCYLQYIQIWTPRFPLATCSFSDSTRDRFKDNQGLVDRDQLGDTIPRNRFLLKQTPWVPRGSNQ